MTSRDPFQSTFPVIDIYRKTILAFEHILSAEVTSQAQLHQASIR